MRRPESLRRLLLVYQWLCALSTHTQPPCASCLVRERVEDYPAEPAREEARSVGPSCSWRANCFLIDEGRFIPFRMVVPGHGAIIPHIITRQTQWAIWGGHGGRARDAQSEHVLDHSLLRNPDVAFIPREDARQLTDAQRWTRGGEPFAPAFVVEIDILIPSLLLSITRCDASTFLTNHVRIHTEKHVARRVGNSVWRDLDGGTVLLGFTLSCEDLDDVLDQESGSSSDEEVDLSAQHDSELLVRSLPTRNGTVLQVRELTVDQTARTVNSTSRAKIDKIAAMVDGPKLSINAVATHSRLVPHNVSPSGPPARLVPLIGYRNDHRNFPVAVAASIASTLRWKQHWHKPPPTGTVHVCHATEAKWNAFADSEDPIVRLNYFEWFPDTEEIHIVEFADAHIEKLNDQFREWHVKRWLAGYMAAKNSQGRRWCPDLSYGPRAHRAPTFRPFLQTFGRSRLKLEFRSSGAWHKNNSTTKAIAIWAAMPGVEPDFTNAECKLYDARTSPLVQLAPFPIVAPTTVIQLDVEFLVFHQGWCSRVSCNSVGGFVLIIGLGNALISRPAISTHCAMVG
ncbi:TPA: LOW QUALITY PROTEIN: hypothetical protein N0F65_012874 [Lagenidium giganteum]|uniref:Uncharacterized protein n=1 Tax=Lagenidium giganteum TaxID=4803 RepID=A0AAV2YJE2_9STRA|nr:TPA: LOW QUALITY PROTEIN: hypothetical protein N0F65_012874 [Lagenidium giganteum]